MSLILDALKKAKELAGRKPAAAPATALASFRFGRPSRGQKIKRIGLYAGLGIVIASSVGYTANMYVKRLRKPRAVLIQAPRPILPDPVPDTPPEPQAAPTATATAATPVPAAAPAAPAAPA